MFIFIMLLMADKLNKLDKETSKVLYKGVFLAMRIVVLIGFYYICFPKINWIYLEMWEKSKYKLFWWNRKGDISKNFSYLNLVIAWFFYWPLYILATFRWITLSLMIMWFSCCKR